MKYNIKAILCCILFYALPAVSQTFFTDVTDNLPVLPASRNISFGDYDNDGLLDAFVVENPARASRARSRRRTKASPR